MSNPEYEWDENDDLYVDGRYVGRVRATGASWKVEFQPEPDALPPHAHDVIAIRPDKLAAQACLASFWYQNRSKF